MELKDSEEYKRYRVKRSDTILQHDTVKGSVVDIAIIVFYLFYTCEEIMIVTGNTIKDVGKVVIFMRGEDLRQEDIELKEHIFKQQIPLGIFSTLIFVSGELSENCKIPE